VLTFEQMETRLGSALPMPAYPESDWWTADSAPRQGTRRRGSQPEALRIPAKTVTFVRA